jgi:hypothetical protein
VWNGVVGAVSAINGLCREYDAEPGTPKEYFDAAKRRMFDLCSWPFSG